MNDKGAAMATLYKGAMTLKENGGFEKMMDEFEKLKKARSQSKVNLSKSQARITQTFYNSFFFFYDHELFTNC